MNKQRRKSISIAIEVINTLREEIQGGALSDVKSDVETFREEEQDYRDNMPEAIGDGEKGDTADCVIDLLQEAVDKLDEALDSIDTALEDAIILLEQASD